MVQSVFIVPDVIQVIDIQTRVSMTHGLNQLTVLLQALSKALITKVEMRQVHEDYAKIPVEQEVYVVFQSVLRTQDIRALQCIVGTQEVDYRVRMLTRCPEIARWVEVTYRSPILGDDVDIPARGHFSQVVRPTFMGCAQAVADDYQSGLIGPVETWR